VTRRADYTSNEWALLKRAVKLVGFAMLAVSKSGPVGKLREITMLSTCLTQRAVPLQFRRNELVLALLDDPDVQALRPFAYISRGETSSLIAAIATARPRLLTCCERVAVLLAEKTPWAEADGLKRWLLWVARSVAEASGDRWLGLGRKLSDVELQKLNEIATSLQISLVAPVPTASELEVMLGMKPQDANGVWGNSDGHGHHRSSDG